MNKEYDNPKYDKCCPHLSRLVEQDFGYYDSVTMRVNVRILNIDNEDIMHLEFRHCPYCGEPIQ